MANNLKGDDCKNIPALIWTGDHDLKNGKPVRFYEFPSDSARPPTDETYRRLAVCQNTIVPIVIFSRNLDIDYLIEKFEIISGICLVGSGEKTSRVWQWGCVKETRKHENEDQRVRLDYLHKVQSQHEQQQPPHSQEGRTSLPGLV